MMQFPFTFTLNVSGLHNPFLVKPGLGLVQSRADGNALSRQIASRSPPKFPPTNFLSPPVPLARKRGWIPSEPEPSLAAATSTPTAGYLDTPAKYKDMPSREPEEEPEEIIAELPPAKRRRTLAGSIMSTALSAALISTAVGLTVYRLWRDRGKQPDQLPPPPPYQRGDWTPDVPEPIEVTPSFKSRKPRPVPLPVRRHVHSRKPRQRLQAVTPPRSTSPAYTTPQSEPDYVQVNHHAGNVEQDLQPEADEMDWIGDRLTRLIQEGQKALGREIVVMSDAKEDEVDDGSDAWEEEPDTQSVPSAVGPSVSRHGSVRSIRRIHKSCDAPALPSYSPYPVSPPRSASPRKRRFESESVHHSPGRSKRSGVSAPGEPSTDSDLLAPIFSNFKEDESAWQSPELRESMERARARYMMLGRVE